MNPPHEPPPSPQRQNSPTPHHRHASTTSFLDYLVQAALRPCHEMYWSHYSPLVKTNGMRGRGTCTTSGERGMVSYLVIPCQQLAECIYMNEPPIAQQQRRNPASMPFSQMLDSCKVHLRGLKLAGDAGNVRMALCTTTLEAPLGSIAAAPNSCLP